MAGTHCRPQLHVLAVKHSVSQLVRAITVTAKLHCLRDNAWLTWSTSEPDILLSLHHNTTTQTDMAGPLISRAGLTDLLCAHCNGCMVASDMPRVQWLDQNTNAKMGIICSNSLQFWCRLKCFLVKYQTVLILNCKCIIFIYEYSIVLSYNCSKRYWNLHHGWGNIGSIFSDHISHKSCRSYHKVQIFFLYLINIDSVLQYPPTLFIVYHFSWEILSFLLHHSYKTAIVTRYFSD